MGAMQCAQVGENRVNFHDVTHEKECHLESYSNACGTTAVAVHCDRLAACTKAQGAYLLPQVRRQPLQNPRLVQRCALREEKPGEDPKSQPPFLPFFLRRPAAVTHL